MYLFFDTETTGLPKNWGAPLTDFANWPRLVQLACVIYDLDGKHLETIDIIAKPEGFTIPAEASRIHGISTEKAIAEGHDLKMILKAFNGRIDKAKYLIAHNMQYDEKIMGAEFLRNGFANPVVTKMKLCTMKESTNWVKAPGPRGYKWPNLQELHRRCFGTGFDSAHNAKNDIEATARCFFYMKENGVAFNNLKS